MKNLSQIIEKLNKATSIEELDKITKICNDFYAKSASNGDKQMLKVAINQKMDAILLSAKALSQKADELINQFNANENVTIEIDGQKYSLNDWLTIKDYCKTFGLKSTSVVTNWAKRGIIPKENILFLKGLNNLKLIKAVTYI